MKANKGFTLIELAVVLAVIAVLAAILTPLVTSYIDQARVTRAQNDVRALAQAYNLHKRDTGQYPLYSNDTDSDLDLASTESQQGEGNTPGLVGVGWTLGSTGDIDEHLNTNKLALATSARGGRVAYRGPYVDLITADPWGNAYVINSNNMDRASSNLGYVVSAGPDGNIDTARDQTGQLTVGGDDIVARIK